MCLEKKLKQMLTVCVLCSAWSSACSPPEKPEHLRLWKREEESSTTLCQLQSMFWSRSLALQDLKQRNAAVSHRSNVFCFVFCRGVLQSLIEKHFPAPDRQKLYSLLGIDLPSKKTPTPAAAALPEQKGKKRKGIGSIATRFKVIDHDSAFDRNLSVS